MSQRSHVENEGNAKDQQPNRCIDQSNLLCPLYDKATKQGPY
jgi:hypothetical protein